MAIFGELQDLTLSEILPLVSGRHGLLEIRGHSGDDRWQLGVHEGRLMAVTARGESLETLEARATVQSLLNCRAGTFEFIEGETIPGAGLHWNITQLLSAFNVLPSVNLGTDSSELPHPESRFVRASDEPPLDEPLFTFWHRAVHRNTAATSVAELAAQAGVSVPATQHYVARLRSLGKLKPHHAFREGSQPKSRRGLARRLLRVLRL